MTIFFCSDHHFYQERILTFKREDGTPLREFDDVEHMHEIMVQRHNSVVRASDKVYFLGDVSMARSAGGLEILGRLNGEKVLIKGNHDLCTAHQYLEHFKDIRACHQFEGVLLSHIPIHVESLGRWGLNIHGHLHYRRVLLPDGTLDKRYYNVSMECINYTPISLEQVKLNAAL